ncbi:hypothetical protein AWB71_05316 [Caballeronia peredens]|nr:hypothetical protein AWB71_05316 [Caballeronia peredens]
MMHFTRLVDFMIWPQKNYPRLNIFEDEVVEAATAVDARLTYLTTDDIFDNLEELGRLPDSPLRSQAININLRLLLNRGRLFHEETLEFLMDEQMIETGAFDDVVCYAYLCAVPLPSIVELARKTHNEQAIYSLHRFAYM